MKQKGLIALGVVVIVGFFLYEPVMDRYFADPALLVSELPVPVPDERDKTRLETDRLELTLSARGGRILSARLKAFRTDGDEPVDLSSGLLATRSGVGIEFPGFPDQPDDHLYQYDNTGNGVRFTQETPQGLRIAKSYRTEGNYGVGFRLSISNGGASPLDFPEGYRLIPFYGIDSETNKPSRHLRAAWLDGADGDLTVRKAKKIHEPALSETEVAWLAVQNRYFTWIAAPDQGSTGSFHPLGQGQVYGVLSAPPFVLEPGETLEADVLLYVGPKTVGELKSYGRGLERIVHYGTFDLLSKGVLATLEAIRRFVGNNGICLILLALALRLLLLPLTQYNLKSLRDMPRILEQIYAIEEEEKEDPAAAARRIAPLKKRQVQSMVGSFLPLAIQIPIFLALYYALDSSIDLRKAAFTPWIQDLSVRDPYFILPLLMGLAMIIQQRLTTTDPQADKTWVWMPTGFALLFSFFPAGLVLFWLADTLCSVGQLAWIRARSDSP